MQTMEAARELAEVILRVGAKLGRTMTVLVTDMDSPLASSVGDAVELDEALRVLQGHDEGRLCEAALAVAEAMLAIRHAEQPELESRYIAVLRHALRDGTAYERFAAMVQAQGGNLAAFARPADPDIAIDAPESGVVTSVDGRAIAEAVVATQSMDKSARVGIRLYKREGEQSNRARCWWEFLRAAERSCWENVSGRPCALARQLRKRDPWFSPASMQTQCSRAN